MAFLERAHRAGIVHRDLKPGNVMLTKSGAKLLDFGLAKPAAMSAAARSASAPLLGAAMTVTSPSPQHSPLTQQGSLMGTVQYMSPEQIQGMEADTRSDIFALGAVLYEMLTGRRAFDGKSQLSVATAILEKDPEPVSSLNENVPLAFAHIVSTCLAKDPDERFACAHDIKLQLKSASLAVVPRSRSGRSGREILLFAALVIAVFAACWLAYVRSQDTKRPLRLMQSELDLFAADVPDQASGGPITVQLAISPDGAYVAYVGGQPGATGTQLWIRRLDSAATTALPGTEEARGPFWSPDSRAVGFFSHGKLKTIVLSTQTVSELCPAPFYWGTWGTRDTIVFAGGPSFGLMQISSSGGTPKEIPSTRDAFRPEFLPDGHHLLYLQWQSMDGPFALKVVDADSGDPKELNIHTTYAVVYASGYLIYSTNGRLVAQSFDTQTLRPISDPVTLVDFGKGFTSDEFPFKASQNGVFVYRPPTDLGSREVKLFSRDGKSIASTIPIGYNNNPVISPDGTKVAYDVTSGVSRDVWIYDLKRKSTSRLTMGQAQSSDPMWSPDGKRMAMSVEDQSKFRIVIMDVDGGRLETVQESTFSWMWVRSWSKDGNSLFVDYYNSGGERTIGVVSLADHKLTELNPGARTASQLSVNVSPDGRWIAYTSDESGHDEVYIQAYPGPGKRVQVSYSGGFMPCWRGDGRELYYISGDEKVTAAAIDYSDNSIRIGDHEELFKVTPLYPSGNPLSVSPDGKLFVVNSITDTRTMPARMIENWQALLKK